MLGPIYMMSIVIIFKLIMTSNQKDFGIFDNPAGPVDVVNTGSVKE